MFYILEQEHKFMLELEGSLQVKESKDAYFYAAMVSKDAAGYPREFEIARYSGEGGLERCQRLLADITQAIIDGKRGFIVSKGIPNPERKEEKKWKMLS